ncbi:DgyrCDS4747 [Dimorphilus gyrociliatus]|uniref:DgyrCDS4747 n=1 Tax=Dimorphilus gyrociliatus TaxID=2664684 RepID=A0A7I8VMK2_9ANNE|nr:DgyrCDS4747 [Dimorphilus gyrociliatus]
MDSHRTTTVHNVNFGGLFGLICLVFSISMVVYVASYASNGWRIGSYDYELLKGTYQEGLWQWCVCSRDFDNVPGRIQKDMGFHRTVQAMTTIGLITLFASSACLCVYAFIHTFDKRLVLLALIILLGVSCLFIFIGFVVYGAKIKTGLHFSYGLVIISFFGLLVSAALAFLQYLKSG